MLTFLYLYLTDAESEDEQSGDDLSPVLKEPKTVAAKELKSDEVVLLAFR